MGVELLQTMMQSPTQASDIFTQTGRFPKQKHVFLVRFIMNNNSGDANLTFAVKTCDRPSVTMTTVELSQYNKKRVVYTGYKNADFNITFYDTADQAAQAMWINYCQYYFGDFSQLATSFVDDIENASSNWVANLGTAGYGYTAANGGQTSFGTQFLIKYIEVLQFNGGTYDTYTLVNPKITVFKPDELDYASAEISTIQMTFQYEAVIFSPGTGGASSAYVEEFQEGGLFNGNPLNIPGIEANFPSEFYVPNASSIATTTSDILGALFGGAVSSSAVAPNYNYYNSTTGGGLGIFGNFIFGAAGGSNLAATASSLVAQSLNNPALTSALGISASVNPEIYPPDPFGIQTGVSSDLYNNVSAIAGSSSSNETTTGILAAGLLTDALVGNSNGGANTAAGMILSAAAFGAINAQRSGTSQYGYNPQITPYGNNYGYQGSGGYTSPPTPTAYSPAQPFGAYVSNAIADVFGPSSINVPTPTPTYNSGSSNYGTVDQSNLVAASGTPLANFLDTAPAGSSYTDPDTGITYNL